MRLRERGEADSVVVVRERGVDVLHERVTEEPYVAAETEVLAAERTDALARAGRSFTEVEAAKGAQESANARRATETRHILVLGDLPLRAAPRESNGGERVAGVRVITLRRVVDLGAVDGGVEVLDGGGGAVHDGSAGVDDGLESCVGVLRPNNALCASRLPETGRGVDRVVLNRAGVF